MWIRQLPETSFLVKVNPFQSLTNFLGGHILDFQKTCSTVFVNARISVFPRHSNLLASLVLYFKPTAKKSPSCYTTKPFFRWEGNNLQEKWIVFIFHHQSSEHRPIWKHFLFWKASLWICNYHESRKQHLDTRTLEQSCGKRAKFKKRKSRKMSCMKFFIWKRKNDFSGHIRSWNYSVELLLEKMAKTRSYNLCSTPKIPFLLQDSL